MRSEFECYSLFKALVWQEKQPCPLPSPKCIGYSDENQSSPQATNFSYTGHTQKSGAVSKVD
jgi:hypothetical protein